MSNEYSAKNTKNEKIREKVSGLYPLHCRQLMIQVLNPLGTHYDSQTPLPSSRTGREYAFLDPIRLWSDSSASKSLLW